MTNKRIIDEKLEMEITDSSFFPDGDLSALISAALVDEALCALLLTRPNETVEFSYGAESFKLTSDEIELLLSVKNPTSLAELVQQITENYAAARHKN